MNVERVRARAMPFESVSAGRLPRYELLFDKVSRAHPDCAHANIAPRIGSLVEGVLYRLADPDVIYVMDQYESTPIKHSREVVEILTNGEPILAWTYFANLAVRRSGCRPERNYLAHLLAGERFLSADYFARLYAVDVADG